MTQEQQNALIEEGLALVLTGVQAIPGEAPFHPLLSSALSIFAHFFEQHKAGNPGTTVANAG